MATTINLIVKIVERKGKLYIPIPKEAAKELNLKAQHKLKFVGAIDQDIMFTRLKRYNTRPKDLWKM